MRLAVSVFVKAETIARTWHRFGVQTNYIGEGNMLSAASIAPPAGTTTAYHWVTGIDVYRREVTNVVVVIGDSNMDGIGSTVDADHRFTNYLARRTPGVGVVNAALHIGINDIGFNKFIPAQRPSAEEVIAALREIAAAAQRKNVKVIFGTLLPWKNAMLFGAPYYSEENEPTRVAVNAWIKQQAAVVDFEAVVQDPADAKRLNASFDLGDHLHCNDAGLEAMANAVELR